MTYPTVNSIPANVPTIEVLYVNNGGEGYAQRLRIPTGTSIATFFAEQMGGGNVPDGWAKRVRRGDTVYGGRDNPIEASFVLEAGDKISITPTKIEGARS